MTCVASLLGRFGAIRGYPSLEERLKPQSILGVIMQLGPLVAPAGGGFIANSFGWPLGLFKRDGP